MAIVYVIAAALGILIYNALSLPLWLSLLVADVAATVVTFFFSVLFGNASVYDPYWSVQPPVILIAFAIGRQSRKEGFADYKAQTRMLLPIKKRS